MKRREKILPPGLKRIATVPRPRVLWLLLACSLAYALFMLVATGGSTYSLKMLGISLVLAIFAFVQAKWRERHGIDVASDGSRLYVLSGNEWVKVDRVEQIAESIAGKHYTIRISLVIKDNTRISGVMYPPWLNGIPAIRKKYKQKLNIVLASYAMAL